MPEPSPCATAGSAWRFVAQSLLALVPVLAWDAGGLDLPLERWFGNARGFALTHAWWLEQVLHTDVRYLAWVIMAFLILAIRRPPRWLAALPRSDRIGLVAGILLAALAVQGLKHLSHTSCPWDLAEFGGRARYVPHWLWGVLDGGAGHCFPAGHASTAFSFLAGWFWLKARAPRIARVWLVASLVLGLALGGVQMVRGAHYLSHVLWAGWFCWVAGGMFWLAVQALKPGLGRESAFDDPAAGRASR